MKLTISIARSPCCAACSIRSAKVPRRSTRSQHYALQENWADLVDALEREVAV